MVGETSRSRHHAGTTTRVHWLSRSAVTLRQRYRHAIAMQRPDDTDSSSVRHVRSIRHRCRHAPPRTGPHRRTGSYAGPVADITTVAVLLAAGAGTRFRHTGHKLLAPLPANRDEPVEPVFARALRHVLAADVGPVVVVTGAVELDVPTGVVTRHNPDWARGQMTSVRAGLDAARRLGAAAVVVGLADQPGVSGDAWRRIAAATDPIAVASYDGVRGNPVRLAAEVWDLLPEGGDEGARGLMRLRPDLVGEVPCTGSSADIDTVEDLRRWQSN